MMIQPISLSNNNYYRKNISFKNNGDDIFADSQTDFAKKRDAAIIDYLEKSQIREKQNQIFAAAIMVLSFAMIPLILTKNIGRKESSKTAISSFRSLKDDKSIPTLETCRSIDKRLKQFLQNQVEYSKATKEDLERAGKPQAANRLILYGAPGSGKTYFAKIFAKTLNADYKEIKYSDLNKQYTGEHIDNIKHTFEDIIKTAQKSPDKKFVVTLNEIDSLVLPVERLSKGTCGHSAFKVEERSVFLNYIDEIAETTPNVTIIGTTNISPKAGGLDGAAMSRFKNIMQVSYPDKECLKEALKANLSDLADGEHFISKNQDNLDKFAQSLVDRKASYRDLNNIVNNSKNYYLRDAIKDKNCKFKFEYLEQAKNDIDLMDGEISGVAA